MSQILWGYFFKSNEMKTRLVQQGVKKWGKTNGSTGWNKKRQIEKIQERDKLPKKYTGMKNKQDKGVVTFMGFGGERLT